MTGSDGIVLGGNRFGKAEVRLVRIDRSRSSESASIALPTDLCISSHLSGDLATVHLEGDNAGVLTTDAQKNTMYAFARDAPIASTTGFALQLARHFVDSVPGVHRAQIEITAYPWSRLSVDGAPAPHSFQRSGGPTGFTSVTVENGRAWVVAGLDELTVMNATDSEFKGFLKDEYTTLPETDERILATAVSARWRYADFAVDDDSGSPVDWDKSAAQCQRLMLDTFAATYSRSLQQTLYSMGKRVLTELPEVMEVRLSMPNKHHFLVDLTPFGRDNPDIVYYAADRPYGLIQGTVTREGRSGAGTRLGHLVSPSAGLARLRALSVAERAEALRGCCASMRWAVRVAEQLDSCADETALHELSERVWWELDASDWREALDAHPKIGERPPEGSQESREQGAMATAGPALRDEIADGNRAYEARFGMTYVVRARGRSPGELLLLLRQRLGNEPEVELRIAAGEQAEITRLRLADLVAQDRAA